MAIEAAGIYLDYSKNRITDETKKLLVQLAEESGLRGRIDAMFRGAKINITENRAVLHVALRAPRGASIVVDGQNVVPQVHAVLDKMSDFCDRVRTGAWKGQTGRSIRNVVNIGIGGSDLGPVMARVERIPEAALAVGGGSFAAFQYCFATMHTWGLGLPAVWPLTDIGGGIFSLISLALFLKFVWRPKDEWKFPADQFGAGQNLLHVQLLGTLHDLDPGCGVALARVIERPVHARVAGAEDFVLRQIEKGVAGGVSVPEEVEHGPLLAVLENVLVVEDDVGHLEPAVRTSSRPPLPLPASANSLGPLTRSRRAQFAWAMTLAPAFAKTSLP